MLESNVIYISHSKKYRFYDELLIELKYHNRCSESQFVQVIAMLAILNFRNNFSDRRNLSQ